MKNIKALAICGSLRKDSFNLKLLKIAIKIAKENGIETAAANLGELNLPVYNYDIETQGFPEPVRQLSEMVKNADLLLIASPEYNFSVSGALKNAIDWVSRVKPNPFSGKAAAIFGASTGPFGTVRGQNQLRQILSCVNVMVLPQPQVLVAAADTVFEVDGSLKLKAAEDKLRELIVSTSELAAKLKITR